MWSEGPVQVDPLDIFRDSLVMRGSSPWWIGYESFQVSFTGPSERTDALHHVHTNNFPGTFDRRSTSYSDYDYAH